MNVLVERQQVRLKLLDRIDKLKLDRSLAGLVIHVQCDDPHLKLLVLASVRDDRRAK